MADMRIHRVHRTVRLMDLPLWLRLPTERFKKDNPDFANAEGAFGECFSASNDFILQVRSFIGYYPTPYPIPRMLRVASVTRDPFYKRFLDSRVSQHWVAKVNDIYIDWTARQFSLRLGFPRIWK
jgi:hypothetical protein